MNEIIILKDNHLDTHNLKWLVEESTSEGFRHIKRLVNDFELQIHFIGQLVFLLKSIRKITAIFFD